MEQINLSGGGKGPSGKETEGLEMEFSIPEISGVVKKIEDEGNTDEDEIEPEEIAFLGFIAALIGRRNKTIREANEKELKAEMDKVHPLAKLLKGCGCGM